MTNAYQLINFPNYYAFEDNGKLTLISVNKNKITTIISDNNASFRLSLNGKRTRISFDKIRSMLSTTFINIDEINNKKDVNRTLKPVTPVIDVQENIELEDKIIDQKRLVKNKLQFIADKTNELLENNKLKHLEFTVEECLGKKQLLDGDKTLVKNKVTEMSKNQQYWQLPSPYNNYVYDSHKKELHSIDKHTNKLKLKLFAGNKTGWQIKNKNNDKYVYFSQLNIELMIFNNHCIEYYTEEKSKATFMVIDTSFGFSMNKEPLISELEASKFCRDELMRNPDKTLLIVKVIGTSSLSLDGKYQCKRLDR